MRELFANSVLYNDLPQRHYRQIAALFEDDIFKCSRWEGEILHTEPFAKTNSDAEILICATRDEAIEAAHKDHEESLNAGWHDYDPRQE
jgi:hypothetical protein